MHDAVRAVERIAFTHAVEIPVRVFRRHVPRRRSEHCARCKRNLVGRLSFPRQRPKRIRIDLWTRILAKSRGSVSAEDAIALHAKT